MKINVRIVIVLVLALMLSMFATAQPAEDGYLRFPITSAVGFSRAR